ncbi:hypothetical protein V8F63_01070 [Brevundimonas sp. LF-1]|uniref:hypothetical protein n=1 Tax=Brevundimonas sp. LF-1 TaxID=3126100 RepID=UPI0030E3C110
MKTGLTLRDIESTKVRDLARGLLDRKASIREQRTTLRRLLEATEIADLETFDTVLRGSSLYSHLQIIDEFPLTPPFEGGGGLSLSSGGQLALDYIAYRVSENTERVVGAFSLFKLLNEAIAAADHVLIPILFDTILTELGHSLALARKAAVVVGYAPKETPSFRYCADLLSSYGTSGKNYGMMVTIDVIASDYNYLDLKSRFRTFASLESGASMMRKLSHLCFNPHGFTHAEAARLVSVSYDISLIDAAFALMTHRAEGLIDVALPAEVVAAWDDLAAMPHHDMTFLVESDPFADLHAFRAASAFLELERFRHIRLALQPLYDLPEFRPAPGGVARAFTQSFFEPVLRILDLVPPETVEFDPLPDRFDVCTAGVLTRSCAVVWVGERDPDFSSVGDAALASLMGHTFEIDRLLSTEVLRRGAASAKDQFVELILQTLLRAHSSATRDSYAFKTKFQKFVREHSGGSILRFLEQVRALSANVVQYFIMLLDETMLSQMAFLMPSSDAIYETRAELLDWFADVADDDVFRKKAGQLRLDRKIAAVRGALNETRLNIDGVRFRQWIEQNKLPEFSDFIRQGVANLPVIGELTDSSKSATRFLTAHRDPTIRALQALVECYEEFCRNPDFGIASFLGRRIRHGTLRGTLLNGLPDAPADLPPNVAAQYSAWRKEFSTSIDAFAGRLYFREKAVHKDGLLSAEVHSPQQWQLCLVCLKAIHDKGQEDSGILFVPAIIESYCWFMFENEAREEPGVRQ